MYIVSVARILVWGGWLALIAFLAVSAGHNPVHPPMAARIVQLSLMPEGWGFFTRNPREPARVAYAITARGLIKLTFANTSLRNLLGISRSARACDAELAALLVPILKPSWSKCTGDPEDFSNWVKLRSLTVKNWSGTQFIGGDILVIERPPIPWAWSSSHSRVFMPSRLVRLHVERGGLGGPPI